MTGPTPSVPRPVARQPAGSGSPAYLAGLLLQGRAVVVVGGGRVAARRVPTLVAAGALVTLIAPRVHASLAALDAAGAIRWEQRVYAPNDLDGAWYVLALTDSADANAAVAADAEARHTFCVRADRASGGSAWTPATGDAAGVTVAAIADHDPLRARRIRDRLVEVVRDESL
jgi:sirohydrochlorin cobaltochelatase